jgi:hypothetical protein
MEKKQKLNQSKEYKISWAIKFVWVDEWSFQLKWREKSELFFMVLYPIQGVESNINDNSRVPIY